jgi:hypothetical protein
VIPPVAGCCSKVVSLALGGTDPSSVSPPGKGFETLSRRAGRTVTGNGGWGTVQSTHFRAKTVRYQPQRWATFSKSLRERPVEGGIKGQKWS